MAYSKKTLEKFASYDRIYPEMYMIDRAIKSTGMACYYYKTQNNEECYYSACYELKMLKKYKNYRSEHRLTQMKMKL